MPTLERDAPWWRTAVIYEIYPRSFQDSDGDGLGDLDGVTRRLDYLAALGVDAIWLAPFHPSSEVDTGYDVTDFRGVDPRLGTLDDVDRLVAEAHRRGIRVVIDLVLNHTSDEHPWFVESRCSRDSPKRDWYVWRDGRRQPDGTLGPPTNWVSRTGGSAWTWDATTEQFYYRFFDVKQPDLNWRTPAVTEAMFDVARFWAARGVDGFRLDAVAWLFEDAGFTDAPSGPGVGEYGERTVSMVRQRDQPEVHDVLRALRRALDALPSPLILIGEIYAPDAAALAPYYGTADAPQIQLPMQTRVGFLNRLDARAFRQRLQEIEARFGDRTPLHVTDNHDRPRSWDRYGDGVHDAAIARVIATILLLSRGAALLYQGQEIGMVTTTPSRIEDVRDPRGRLTWPGDPGRDGARTPMQWDGTPGAGFTTGVPWLPIPASAAQVNVAAQEADPGSLLAWYRALIALRRARPAVAALGTTTLLDRDADGALVWVRRDRGGRDVPLLVACNLRADAVTLDVSECVPPGQKLVPVLAAEGASVRGARVTLSPHAVLVADLSG